jgi:hypothetical protein
MLMATSLGYSLGSTALREEFIEGLCLPGLARTYVLEDVRCKPQMALLLRSAHAVV